MAASSGDLTTVRYLDLLPCKHLTVLLEPVNQCTTEVDTYVSLVTVFYLSLFQLSGSFFRGTSLLVRDSTGCSALHLASQHGHTEVVHFILEHGECVSVCLCVCVCVCCFLLHPSNELVCKLLMFAKMLALFVCFLLGSKVLLDLTNRET